MVIRQKKTLFRLKVCTNFVFKKPSFVKLITNQIFLSKIAKEKGHKKIRETNSNNNWYNTTRKYKKEILSSFLIYSIGMK